MISSDQTLVANSSAGIAYPVSLTSTTLGVCTVVDGAIHVVAAGTCSITASQAGDGTYSAASSVSKSIVISKLTQTITFTQPTAMNLTSADQVLTASTTAGISYSIIFTSTTLGVCTVVDGAIRVVAVGTCSITASQAGDGTYSAASNIRKNFTIGKAPRS